MHNYLYAYGYTPGIAYLDMHSFCRRCTNSAIRLCICGTFGFGRIGGRKRAKRVLHTKYILTVEYGGGHRGNGSVLLFAWLRMMMRFINLEETERVLGLEDSNRGVG